MDYTEKIEALETKREKLETELRTVTRAINLETEGPDAVLA